MKLSYRIWVLCYSPALSHMSNVRLFFMAWLFFFIIIISQLINKHRLFICPRKHSIGKDEAFRTFYKQCVGLKVNRVQICCFTDNSEKQETVLKGKEILLQIGAAELRASLFSALYKWAAAPTLYEQQHHGAFSSDANVIICWHCLASHSN